MISQLGKQYNLPVRSAFSTVRGFYIQLYCGGKEGISAKDLPPVFIKVTKFKNTLNFTTPDLVSSAVSLPSFLFSTSLPMFHLPVLIDSDSGACVWLSEDSVTGPAAQVVCKV